MFQQCRTQARPGVFSLVAVVTGEEMKAESVAEVALLGIELVKSIVLAGHNINDVRTRLAGAGETESLRRALLRIMF